MRTLITLTLLFLTTAFLPAQQVVNLRSGLPNFQAKLNDKSGAGAKIAYFGGSITAGAGASKPQFCYRELLHDWLRKQNPGVPLHLQNNAIGGTGSWLGAFRCWNEVGYYRPDLVIVEFAVNDGGKPEDEVIASMEGIVRQLRARTPSRPDILFVYTLVAGHLEDFKVGKLPPTIQHHEKVAEHYGVPSVVMAKHAADQILSGKLTIEQFAKDNIHPTDAGYALYLEALQPFFQKVATLEAKLTDPNAKVVLPAPLSPRPLENARLVPYDWAQMDSGWLGWQLSNSDRLPHVAVSDTPGATITLKFKGAQVGLYDMIGPDSGNLEYRIDGSEWKPKARFDKYCLNSTRLHATVIESGLDPKKDHILELRIAEAIPEGSKGRFSRIGWFLVDGEGVDPNAGLDPLTRIDAVYKGMKPVTWTAPVNRWENLEKTKAKLANGPAFRFVMLGDSIIGDTSSSEFEHLLRRNYPKTEITKILSVRGSTGCWWYKDENRVEDYVLRHSPDLLIIGGISQRDDIEAIRSVIHQCRAKIPGLEVLLLSPTFGAPQGELSKNWTPQPDAKAYPYRANLQKLAQEEKCGFFDMTGPWYEYIRDSGYALDSFKRDPIHANARGSQILGRLLEKFLAP